MKVLIASNTMSQPALEYDFPPPIRLKEIRLVLPEEDEISETQSDRSVGGDLPLDISCHVFGESSGIASLESELNELESALIEREEAVNQAEARIAERERSLWEFEALILAREKLLNNQQHQLEKQKTMPSTEGCKEAIQALEQLRAEVAQQQERLEDAKKDLMEREAFVEVSEERLLEKTMQQQEEESRLEQMKEDLDARELRINRMEGKPPPPQIPKEVL